MKVILVCGETFAALDDVLIERLFQPASDLISYRIGLSRTAAACFCIDVACLAWIVSRARALSDAVRRGTPRSILRPGVAAAGSRCPGQPADAVSAHRRQAGNPLRLAMQPHRAIVLLMLVSSLVQLQALSLADAADLAMLICAASALYLGACAERPPVRRGRWPRSRCSAGSGMLVISALGRIGIDE